MLYKYIRISSSSGGHIYASSPAIMSSRFSSFWLVGWGALAIAELDV